MNQAPTPLGVVASSSAVAPPYAHDTKAKGWRFELDYERIEQSDTWVLAPAEIRPWLLMMWLTAWRQIPCGSLPAVDELIAARIGMDLRQFRAHRDILMRGWFLASDGRMYHHAIAEQVVALIIYREKEAARKQEYRDKRNQWLAENCPVGQTRDGHGSPSPATTPEPVPEPEPLPKPEQLASKAKTARKRAAPSALVSLQDLVAEGVDKQHATDWLAARKAKRLPLTPTAWSDTKAEATKAGLSPPEAIKRAACNGWAGFKASWPDPGEARAGPSNGSSAYDRKAADAAKWLKGTSLDRSIIFDQEAFDADVRKIR